MTDEALKKKRDELAKQNAEETWHSERHELEEEEQNTFDFQVADFKRGFDAGELYNKQLLEEAQKAEEGHYNEILFLEDKLAEALAKITSLKANNEADNILLIRAEDKLNETLVEKSELILEISELKKTLANHKLYEDYEHKITELNEKLIHEMNSADQKKEALQGCATEIIALTAEVEQLNTNKLKRATIKERMK